MTDLFEILRYLAVGGLVTVADIIVYNLLTGETRRMPRVPANILSVTVGMILGFSLHFAVVFQPREALLAERLTRYVLVVGVSVYGVQNLVIYTLAELWRSPVRLAQTFTQNLSEKCVARVAHSVTVAQIFNLPYRGIEFRKAPESSNAFGSSNATPIPNRRDSRVQLCATPHRAPRTRRIASPFLAATCHQEAQGSGHSPQPPVVLFHRDGVAQTVPPEFQPTPRFSDDFIDRIFGKVAAALAGVIWNFVFFKCFVYAGPQNRSST